MAHLHVGEVTVSMDSDEKDKKLLETAACYLGEQDGIELLQQINAKWVCSGTSQAFGENHIIQKAKELQKSKGASSCSEVPVVITDVANALKILCKEVCLELTSLKFKENMNIEYSDPSYLFKCSEGLRISTLKVGVRKMFDTKIKLGIKRLEAFYQVMNQIAQQGNASEIIEQYFKDTLV